MALNYFGSKTFEANTFEAGLFTGVGSDVVVASGFVCGTIRVVPSACGTVIAGPSVVGRAAIVPSACGTVIAARC